MRKGRGMDRVQHAPGLPSRDLLGNLTRQLGQARLLVGLGDVEPVHGLGESQVGGATGNDDACIYREQLDAHNGDAK